MPYNYNKFDNRRKAKFMLEKLLPQAEEFAKQQQPGEKVGEPASLMGANAVKHLRISAVSGVHIYQGERGGWFADLTFDGLPPGVPSVIGTPSSEPNGTREEAIQEAIGILATVIVVEANRPAADEEPVAIFEFDNIALTIPSAMIRDLEANISQKPGVAYIAQRLDGLRDQLADGRPFTEETFRNLPEDDKRRVVAIAALAVAEGMIRWPENREAAPIRPTRH